MEPNKRMEAVKAHFEGEAGDFEDIIAKTIPHYGEMQGALVSAMPFPTEAKIDVIDLGSGTGSLSWAIRKAFPNARITCLDISEKMLAASRSRLGDNNARYLLMDFSKYPFDAIQDAVVSSLALHHLEVTDRQQFFANIFRSLRGGGVFLNADIMLTGSVRWQQLCLRKWVSFLEQSLSRREVKELMARYRTEDRPVSLPEDLERLRRSGFRKPDVLWKNYGFAVYGAMK
jgi:tRNA (cmo5U34)-methyltransferase